MEIMFASKKKKDPEKRWDGRLTKEVHFFILLPKALGYIGTHTKTPRDINLKYNLYPVPFVFL